MEKQYDLAIIGAGIYGAAMAMEASRHGLSVVLFDKGDLGAATSANSLKVIHGGLRYLQSLDIPRTIYSAAERRLLMQYAPDLIRPLHCRVPLKRSVVKNELSVGLVAGFYNWLTRRRNNGMPVTHQVPDAHRVSRDDYQATARVPLRNPGDFALDWHDAQAIDTERLLLRMVQDAAAAGARICNYQRVDRLAREGATWRLDTWSERSGQAEIFRARGVVDCSGAWSVAERLLELPTRRHTPRGYVKAVNLITRKSLGDSAFGFNSRQGDQGRLLFCAPCGDHTLIGTWYYAENTPDAPVLDRNTLDQCLTEVNEAFTAPVLQRDDITQVHVGYLPASGGPGQSSEREDPERWLQRHNQTLTWPEYPGLWVIKGTKYTTARYTAEQFLRHAAASLTTEAWRPPHPSAGQERQAAGGQRHAAEQSLEPNLRESLSRRHGSRLSRVLAFAAGSPEGLTPLAGSSTHLAAEVRYAVEQEWAMHLDDILVRRLGLAALELPSTETIRDVLGLLRRTLGWDDHRCYAELERLQAGFPDWIGRRVPMDLIQEIDA